MKTIRILTLLATALPLTFAQRLDNWAIVLDTPSAAEAVATRAEITQARGRTARAQAAASQAGIKAALASRKIPILGAVDVIANAVFVSATDTEAAQLRQLPGVSYVQRMPRFKKHLTKALDLVNASSAWNAFGGSQNAGAGIRIAIIDSGIDNTHPAFQDNTLPVPAGFPKCVPADCPYANRKIIAVRSYVGQLVNFVAGDSRPDDLTPRDRSGHGTAAAMIAAGVRVNAPGGSISGIAPKAYLGNYKVFGAPGVNDIAFGNVVLTALNDAFVDGMDVANLSVGSSALYGVNEAFCTNNPNKICDVIADGVRTAIKRGMTIVVSAGNDGDSGSQLPTLGTINSPGTVPEAITVGATTSSHRYLNSVRIGGPGVPATLTTIPALLSADGLKLTQPLTAPVKDVSKLQNDGKACDPLATGSLTGSIALIDRGTCAFAIKIINAQKAGAVGVLLNQSSGNDFINRISGVNTTAIPVAIIGDTAGKALKSYLSNNQGNATLDPALLESTVTADEVAYFSSQGPTLVDMVIKPELVSVGYEIYTAAQRLDPNGELFDPSGYTNVSGSSFAAPMVAGAVALAKQKYPSATPAQLKSLVVNTANGNLIDYDYNNKAITARVTAVGAGKLDAGKAVTSNITSEPATLSFGVITQVPQTQTFRLTNLSNLPQSLRLAINRSQASQDLRATLALSSSTVTLPAGGSANVTLTLTGQVPSPGQYDGVVTVSGGAADLRIPFLYLVGDGKPFHVYPIENGTWTSIPTGQFTIQAKFLDQFGVPVNNLKVAFRAAQGGGKITRANDATEEGIASADVVAGTQLGEQLFTVETQDKSFSLEFPGRTYERPTIRASGVVNAASGREESGVAPGSYISIFGSGLSESLRIYSTTSLPYSLANVSVGFDLPNGRASYPGRLHFVSATQVNVQVPWELQGQTGVNMKVSLGEFSSDIYNLKLNDYSPALFEYTDAASGGRSVIAALDGNFKLISGSNPVARGGVAQLYANGIGPVDNAPPSGDPAATERLTPCRVQPTVTIGGRPAQVLFCGLAPGFVGLYQLNVAVPGDAPSGVQPVVITSSGIQSKSSLLPIL